MKKLKPIKIVPVTVEHFDPEGNSLGFLTDDENMEFRAQIAENKAEGYYLILNGERINIGPDGREDRWVKGLYDEKGDLMTRLFKAQHPEHFNN